MLPVTYSLPYLLRRDKECFGKKPDVFLTGRRTECIRFAECMSSRLKEGLFHKCCKNLTSLVKDIDR